MAKLNRERRLIERRLEKKARKDARKREAALHPDGVPVDEPADGEFAGDETTEDSVASEAR
jgi:hypothetical protein